MYKRQFWEYDLDMSRSSTGWTEEMNIPSSYGDGGYARVNGMRNMDYIGLTVRAVDATGQEYKTGDTVKWMTTEALPDPVDMDDALLEWYVADLIADIAALEEEIAAADSTEAVSLEQNLMTLRSNFDLACEDPRADCPSEEVKSSGGDAAASGLNMNVVFIVIGVLVVAALLGLMFMRNGAEEEEPMWNEAALPVHDTVANSMYGGSQDLFQQAPPPSNPMEQASVPEVEPNAPPIPESGLPEGWTMEQWQYLSLIHL